VTAAKKNLILGTVMHYEYDVIKPFVSSLRSTDYSGDIVLFHSNIALRTLKRLRRKGVTLISFDHAFPHLDRTLAKYVTRWADNRRIRTLGVYCFRYLLAYCYLNEFREKYHYVMVTDVRDVIFQNDPFNFPIGNKLCCFMEREGTSLGREPANAEWLELAFDKPTLERLNDKPIVCSGVTIGPSNLMIDYLETMIEIFVSAPGKGWEIGKWGLDQPVHNYLIYTQPLPEIVLYANDAGPVLTVGIEDKVSVNRSGVIVNKRNHVPNIVHQYDRHWHVAKRLYSFRTIWKHHGGSRAVFSTAVSLHAPQLHRMLVRARNAFFQ
jgi:hypothetical protein